MDSMQRLDQRVKACNKHFKELEFELAASSEEVVQPSPQLLVANSVCNKLSAMGMGLAWKG